MNMMTPATRRIFTRYAAAALMTLGLGAGLVGTARASDADTAQELVDEAAWTVQSILSNKNFKGRIDPYLAKAKAVMIFPSYLKAGLIVGGEGGSGVLLGRAANGEWSYPAFFNMGGGSFGLQIGGQKSELMLVFMTTKGLDAVMKNRVTVGGDISAAVGPLGEGYEAQTTTNLDADILSYRVNEGAFIGASIEGAAIWERDSLNRAYYGWDGVTARAIVFNGDHRNPAADKLRETLTQLPK